MTPMLTPDEIMALAKKAAREHTKRFGALDDSFVEAVSVVFETGFVKGAGVVLDAATEQLKEAADVIATLTAHVRRLTGEAAS